MPGASSQVDRAIRTDASRIPPIRIGRTAFATALQLTPESATRIRAAVTIDDGRSAPFSVGFTVALRHGRWLVTSISPPG